MFLVYVFSYTADICKLKSHEIIAVSFSVILKLLNFLSMHIGHII